MILHLSLSFFFFFNDTATTEIYTLSLHDALPIWLFPRSRAWPDWFLTSRPPPSRERTSTAPNRNTRSEEHTSELQSPCNLVCRLLLEKKKNQPLHPSYTPNHSSVPVARTYDHHAE